MSDIVERLGENAAMQDWTTAALERKVERLTLENWQLKGALGYAVPGDVPDNGPFKCGLCDAKTRGIIEAEDEIERLRAALQRLVDNILDYERVNKLAPNPPRLYCWDAVADAVAILPPAAAAVAAATKAAAAEPAGVAPTETPKR